MVAEKLGNIVYCLFTDEIMDRTGINLCYKKGDFVLLLPLSVCVINVLSTIDTFM